MRRILVAILIAVLALGTFGISSAAPGDHGNACPPSSPGSGGDPACGKSDEGPPPPPPPPEECALGDLTGALNDLTGNNIRDVFCAVHDLVLELTGESI